MNTCQSVYSENELNQWNSARTNDLSSSILKTIHQCSLITCFQVCNWWYDLIKCLQFDDSSTQQKVI